MTGVEGVAEAEAAVPSTEAIPRSRLRRVLLPAARAVFTLAVVCAVVYATVSQWSEVRSYLSGLSWPFVLLSLIMALTAAGAAAMGWRAALAAIGYQVTPRLASQIYLVGMLAKYLPGSVWAFVLQMELGKRANLPRSRPFLASVVATGLGVTVALPLGMFALPAVVDVGKALAVAVLILIPVALFCAHPRVLTWLLRRVMKIVRRPTLDAPITWRALASVVGWTVTTFLALGLHVWLLADGAAGPGLSGLSTSIGAAGLGISLGMLAFLAPSGLGVREAIIVAALLPTSSPGIALGIALASRLVLTLSDLLAAGLASLGRLTAARPASDEA